jgi:hypothetical protein
VSLAQVRSEFNCSLAARQRSGEVALFAQEAAEVGVRQCKIRQRGDGAAIAGTSLGRPPRGSLGIPEVGMGLGRIRQHPHRLADQLNRALGASLAKSEETEQVKRVGVVGGFFKDFTVERGGSLEAPSLVVLKGSGQFRR